MAEPQKKTTLGRTLLVLCPSYKSIQGYNMRKITLTKILVPLCRKHEVFGGVCWRGIRGERVSVSRLTYAAVSVLTISSGSST